MIKAVIFDCFGVIRLDSSAIAYKQLGGDYETDREFIERTIAAANAGQIPSPNPMIAGKLGVSETAWRQAYETASAIDQEVLDYILELRAHYKIGMLTNMSAGGLQRWFDEQTIQRYFDVAIASGDIGVAKPDIRAYHIMAKRLGVPAQACVFIDDRQPYCAAAEGAGMQAIHYTGLRQLRRELAALLVSRS
ncbi:MAG TPA: HAD family phosphatase [Candidatus Saccharimonadales bacterium]|nr:HAD family phosphatase [Candidatus Saccharimonadales bacterium]